MDAGLPNRDLVEAEPAKKLCAACGAEFSCGAAAGACWCEEVSLSAETTAALRVRYSDCLCPRCLANAKV